VLVTSLQVSCPSKEGLWSIRKTAKSYFQSLLNVTPFSLLWNWNDGVQRLLSLLAAIIYDRIGVMIRSIPAIVHKPYVNEQDLSFIFIALSAVMALHPLQNSNATVWLEFLIMAQAVHCNDVTASEKPNYSSTDPLLCTRTSILCCSWITKAALLFMILLMIKRSFTIMQKMKT